MAADFVCSMARPLRRIRVHSHPAQAAGGDGAGRTARRLLGYAEQAAAEAARAERTTRAIEELSRAVAAAADRVDAMVADGLGRTSELATQIGLAIAREVVGDELLAQRVDPTAAVIECLRVMHEDGREGAATVEVRLAADDLDTVLAGLQRRPDLQGMLQRASFVGDPSVPIGAAEVQSGFGTLRHDPRDVLERICRSVQGADPAQQQASGTDARMNPALAAGGADSSRDTAGMP